MALRVSVPRMFAVGLIPVAAGLFGHGAESFPVPIQQGGVTYISGGIGDDEIAAMKASVTAYNLLISNAENDNSYTAGIDVTIRDGRGQAIFSAKDTGPLLYIKLPPGDYTLDALYHGIENVREISIGPKRPTEINLIWPTIGG